MSRFAGATLAALAVVALAAPVAWSGGDGQVEMEIRMRYSAFEPSELRVPAGRPIEITLVNHDPIDHEWILGPEEVHAGHRTGTDHVHDSRVTEVSIPALSARVTTVTFDEPGTLLFVCHLPGHEAYGMVGRLRVG